MARARKFYEETLGLKSGLAGNRDDNWWVEYDLPGWRPPTSPSKKPSDTAGGTIVFEMSFIVASGSEIIAIFPQNGLQAMRPGAGAKPVFAHSPGRIYGAEITEVLRVVGADEAAN